MYTCITWINRGDGLAQLVEHQTRIQRMKVQILSGAQENVSFSQSKRLCRLAVGVLNTRVYSTHKNDHVRMVKILWSTSEFSGLRKLKKTQHALENNS